MGPSLFKTCFRKSCCTKLAKETLFFLQAADFLAATAAIHSLSSSFPIYRVHGVADGVGPLDNDTPNRSKYILTGVILTVLVGLLLGVLVQAQKKRAHGITWFPEGFLRNNRYQLYLSLLITKTISYLLTFCLNDQFKVTITKI